MATHAVGYALNEVLELFEVEGIWAALGRERTVELVLKIVEIARRNDCGSGDVLQDVGWRLGVCRGCLRPAERFENGFCPECHADWIKSLKRG